MTFKYRHAKPLVIPSPTAQARPIVAVSLVSAFPSVAISGVVVADHVPSDEMLRLPLLFCRLQSWLYRVFSPMQSGLEPIDANPEVALAQAYSKKHRQCFAPPRRPPEFVGDLDLGHLAVASPYTSYLERTGPSTFKWDFLELNDFECHAGLRPPGARVDFSLDTHTRSLRATRIESDLGSCTPGSSEWEPALRLALCGLTTHSSLVRHFNWLHLVGGGPLSFVTRNCLNQNHPVRRLLQPHVYATHASNQMVTIDQMTPGGDFENIFSFTHRGMCELYEATWANFDLQKFNPAIDALRRGVDAPDVETPALENYLALMEVFEAHVRRYLSLYFEGDDAFANDAAVAQWIESLGAYLPRGVSDIAGTPLSLEGAVRVISTFIYMTTVEHEVLGSGVWNYQLWNDAQPVRVYQNGERPPLDVYQRLVNANFNLNVRRTPLMSDFSSLALDARGAKAFRAFRADLALLQESMDGLPATCWRIEPKYLKANINA